MIFETVIKTVLTLLLGGIYGAGLAMIRNHRSNRATYEEAIKVVIHDSYFRCCRYILSSNSEGITRADYENFDKLYQTYHSLGMNGTGDKLYEQVTKSKPIVYKEI